MSILGFKSWLNEAKQRGTLYHFTTPYLFDMMSSEDQQTKNIGSSDLFAMFSFRGLSLTRNALLASNPFNDISINNGYCIRIAVDGNSLSDRYQIKPVLGFTINQPEPKEVLNTNSKITRMKRDSGENEELVLPKNEIVKLSPFIKQIDLLPVALKIKGIEYDETWYKTKQEELRSKGFKVNIVRKFTIVK